MGLGFEELKNEQSLCQVVSVAFMGNPRTQSGRPLLCSLLPLSSRVLPPIGLHLDFVLIKHRGVVVKGMVVIINQCGKFPWKGSPSHPRRIWLPGGNGLILAEPGSPSECRQGCPVSLQGGNQAEGRAGTGGGFVAGPRFLTTLFYCLIPKICCCTFQVLAHSISFFFGPRFTFLIPFLVFIGCFAFEFPFLVTMTFDGPHP